MTGNDQVKLLREMAEPLAGRAIEYDLRSIASDNAGHIDVARLEKSLGELAASKAAALTAGAEALEQSSASKTVQQDAKGGATEYGLHRWAGPVLNGFISLVTKDGRTLHCDWHPTLEAARAAAVAWAEKEEGK